MANDLGRQFLRKNADFLEKITIINLRVRLKAKV